MKVIKIGGGCLKGQSNIDRISNLLIHHGAGHILVVSALNGVTDRLLGGIAAVLTQERSAGLLVKELDALHSALARHLIGTAEALNSCLHALNEQLAELERLLLGLTRTREVTPGQHDTVASYGERLSAALLCGILNSRGINAVVSMPHQNGLITDGKYGDATADLPATARNFSERVLPLLARHSLVIIPGFYGVSRKGEVTTFGRGGSDYSAAAVAAAVDAELLEIWKDVDGFMSADPNEVPEARLIHKLSYGEAAELAYFGAKILHPRTVEPLRSRRVAIAIKNTLAPESVGTLITSRSPVSRQVIKSVAYTTDIGILKVHASGVGARPGILAQVASAVSGKGINIKSVVTSQTCISLLLARGDLLAGRNALIRMRPRPYRKIETCDELALIAIVGDGLLRRRGVAARCFNAVAQCNVNVEMISFGPSPSALYFLTGRRDLPAAVNAIHTTFFGTLRCAAPHVLIN
jgi:bifunctional aspartokinase / homoserine dehydrogenase 1